MNTTNSTFYLPNQPEYAKNFWNHLCGQEGCKDFLEAGNKPYGYVLPATSEDKFEEQLKRESLFRTIGTYVYSHGGPSKIIGTHSVDAAAWVPEGNEVPAYDGINDFTTFSMQDHKLAAILKMDADFLHDNRYIFADHFIKRMARCFGQAESDGFINGTGAAMPTGILSESGAAIGVTASELSFDDVTRLYFSVDKQFREKGAWLMNDETALALRLLKDQNGNSLWNHVNDTILGKTVYINNRMPSAGKGAKPIAFGDFSFYWIVEREPLTVTVLREKFYDVGQIGYLAYEFLDGKLIQPDAVKVLQITA